MHITRGGKAGTERRAWTRRAAVGVVASLTAGIALLLTTSAQAQDTFPVRLVDSTGAVPDGAPLLDLAQAPTYDGAVAAIAALTAPGETATEDGDQAIHIAVPIAGVEDFDLPSTSLTTSAAAHALVLRSAVEHNGATLDASLIVDWASATDTEPKVVVALHGTNVGLNVFNPAWPQNGILPSLTDGWLFLSAGEHQLDGTAIGAGLPAETIGVVAGGTFRGTFDTRGTALGDAIKLVGLEDGAVRVAGSLGTDGGLLSGGQPAGELTVQLTRDDQAPSWLTEAGATLSLTFADGTATVAVDGTYGVTLGETRSTFTGGLTLAASSTGLDVTATLKHTGKLVLPGNLSWVEFNDASLLLQYQQGKATAKLTGAVTAGTSRVNLDASFVTDGSDLSFGLDVRGPVVLADVARLVGEATGGIDPDAVRDLGDIQLDALKLAFDKTGDAITMSGQGTATIRGTKASLLLSVVDKGAASPTRIVAGFHLERADGQPCCSTLRDLLGPSVSGVAGDLPVPDLDLVFMHGAQTMGQGDLTDEEKDYFKGIYGSDLSGLSIKPGLSLTAEANLAFLGDAGLQLLGLTPQSTVRIEGYIGTAMGTVGTNQAGEDLGIHLTAVLPKSTGSSLLPEWLGFQNQWTLEIKAVQGAVELQATGTMQARIGDETLPETTLVASFQKDDAGVRASLSASVGTWETPFDIEWFTLKSVEVEGSVEKPAGGSVQVSATLDASFTITVNGVSTTFDVGAAFEHGDGTKVTFTAGLAEGEDITFREVLQALGVTATLPDALDASIDEAELEVEAGTDGVSVSLKSVASLRLTEDLTLSARLLASLETGGEDGTQVSIGVRPEGTPTLGTFLPATVRSSLPPSLAGLQVPSFGLAFSTQDVDPIGSDAMEEDEREFFAPLYGCDLAKGTGCPFEHHLDGGLNVLGAISLPEDVRKATDVFGLDTSKPALVRGTLPIMGGSGLPNLAISVPMPTIAGMPEFLHSAAVELKIGGTGLFLGGELQVKFQRPDVQPINKTCTRGTYLTAFPGRCYDLLTFKVGGGIIWDAGSVALNISGTFLAAGDDGWLSPFGVGDWIGIKKATVSFTGIPSTKTVALGMQADVRVAGKDLAGAINVALNIIAPTPPFVIPELLGFRVSTTRGFELQDIVNVQNDFARAFAAIEGQPAPRELTLADDALPNVAIRNVDLMYARQTVPDLCLTAGLAIRADLYVNPTDASSGLAPEYDSKGCRKLPANGDPKMACAAQKDKGCFANVLVQVTTSGIVAEGSIGAFEIGALKWDDARASLSVTLNALPHLKVKGAARIDGLFTGAIDLELSEERMHVMGDVTILDGAAGAYVYGDASLDMTHPVIDVKVALHADFNNSIAKALDGPLRGVRTTTLAMDQLWQTLLDLSAQGTNKVEVLKALPGQLRAAGVPVDADLERIITIAADIENALKLFQGGSSVIHTVLNGIQFPAFQGWEIGYVPATPRCLMWDVNGGCWFTPPIYIQPFSWFDLFGCFCWRDVPGRWDYTFAIPLPITQPACIGEVHGGRCYALLFGPKPAWEIPGVCDWSPKMKALGRDCDLRDVVEQLVGPEVGKIIQTVARLDKPPTSITGFLDQVVGKLDGALNMVKLECAEFGLRLDGNATNPTADVSLALRANVFGNQLAWGSKWNFAAPMGQGIDKTVGDLFTSLTNPQPTTCVGRQRPTAPPLALTAADSVNERGELVVTGTFDTAPTPQAPQTVTIEWGDGTTSTVQATQKTFTASHAYADDEPTGVPGASMVIRASGGGALKYAAEHVVALANVAPTNIRATVTSGAEGSPTTLVVAFDDPSDLDSHQVQVDWGDGGGLQLVPVAAGVRTATITHVYAQDGDYPLAVSVVDDDTGRGSVLADAVVANDAPGDLAVKLAAPAAEGEDAPTFATAVDAPSFDEGGTRALLGTFTDDGRDDEHELVVDWGDGSPVQTVELAPGARTFEVAHLWVDDPTDPADLSRVRVTVRDADGGEGTLTKDATVANVMPGDVRIGVAVAAADGGDALSEDGVAVEGAVAVIAGTFNDPGTADDHVVTVAWGDGSAPETLQVPAGSGSFQVQHRFVDDDPTSTPLDLSRIEVTIADDDGGVGTTSSEVEIVNLDPTALTFAPAAARVDEAASVTYEGSFVDPGEADTFTVDVDWGDGSTDRLTVPAGTRDFDVAHTYVDDDLSPAAVDRFPVTVTVTDDDTGSVTLETGVDVHNVAPSAVTPVLDAEVVDEDGSVRLDVDLVDPGTADTHVAVVDWGDGSTPSTVELAAGVRAFELVHRYLDDHVPGTPSDTFTISVTVTDDDTGVGTAATEVTVDDVAPAITAFGPVDDRIEEAEVVRFEGAFTDPGTLDTNTVVVDWGDGTEPSVLELGVGVRDFAVDHVYVDDDPTGSSSDPYDVTVTVTDDDSLADEATEQVTVHDVAPSAVAFAPDSRVDEAASVTWNGTFADPGVRDAHVVVVDWGDGTAATVLELGVGERAFAADHVYVDDDPTASGEDPYDVTVTVTDDDELVGSFAGTFTVHDVAPSALAVTVTPPAFDEDGTTVLDATFVDPGTLDTATVLVDWGEGTVDRLDLAVGERSFRATHQYGDDGRFPVTVTVTDDDTKSVKRATSVTVRNVAPTLDVPMADPMWVDAAGGRTLTTRAGEARTPVARSTDPGSDDLSFTWTWGDGTTSPGVHRNGQGVDPDPSPTVGPRDVTDSQAHTWAKPCLYRVDVDVVDDDEGAGPRRSAWAIVTGTAGRREGTGWWHSRYDGKGGNDLPADVQSCYLRIAQHASSVFGEARQAGTAAQATAILAGAGSDPRDQLDRTLLSVWLDHANGAFRWNDRVDTNGDGRPDAVFAEVMQAAERVRLDPAATKDALHAQRQRLQRTTLPGVPVPADQPVVQAAPPVAVATAPKEQQA